MCRLILIIPIVFGLNLLSGCLSTFKSDCSTVANDPMSYQLCMANNGDKESQYQIGKNEFEDGDSKIAVKWLKKAAAPVTGRKSVYLPPVGNEKYGSTISVETGQMSSGHNGAQVLLAKIYEEGLGVKADPKQARKYKRMSSKIYNFSQ